MSSLCPSLGKDAAVGLQCRALQSSSQKFISYFVVNKQRKKSLRAALQYLDSDSLYGRRRRGAVSEGGNFT